MDDHETYFPDRCVECPALLSEDGSCRCAECLERAEVECEDRSLYLQRLMAG